MRAGALRRPLSALRRVIRGKRSSVTAVTVIDTPPPPPPPLPPPGSPGSSPRGGRQLWPVAGSRAFPAASSPVVKALVATREAPSPPPRNTAPAWLEPQTNSPWRSAVSPAEGATAPGMAGAPGVEAARPLKSPRGLARLSTPGRTPRRVTLAAPPKDEKLRAEDADAPTDSDGTASESDVASDVDHSDMSERTEKESAELSRAAREHARACRARSGSMPNLNLGISLRDIRRKLKKSVSQGGGKKGHGKGVHVEYAAVVTVPKATVTAFLNQEHLFGASICAAPSAATELAPSEAAEAAATVVSALAAVKEIPATSEVERLTSASASTVDQLKITSIGERKMMSLIADTDDTDHKITLMQQRTKRFFARVYPGALRLQSTNLDPLPLWAVGTHMVALNMQTNDLSTQLHHALFAERGYVLKPQELRTPGAGWPPTRPMLHRVSLRLLSLQHLPTRREARPRLAESSLHPHSRCHRYIKELSGKAAPPEPGTVASPTVTVELHAIGGPQTFAQVSLSMPPRSKRVLTKWTAPAIESNGLNPRFPSDACDVHCLAAEQHYTILRISVSDDGQEVAYETAVLSSLRPGVRCFELRSARTGTRIELCTLLVEIELGEEPYALASLEMLKDQVRQQQAIIEDQNRKLRAQDARVRRLEGGLPATATKATSTDGFALCATPTASSASIVPATLVRSPSRLVAAATEAGEARRRTEVTGTTPRAGSCRRSMFAGLSTPRRRATRADSTPIGGPA